MLQGLHLDTPINILVTIVCWSFYYTVDREIFVAKNFRRSPSTMKIKQTKYFLPWINWVSLYCQVIIATKIKPGKNLTAEIFYRQKIPDLWYTPDRTCCLLVISTQCCQDCISHSYMYLAWNTGIHVSLVTTSRKTGKVYFDLITTTTNQLQHLWPQGQRETWSIVGCQATKHVNWLFTYIPFLVTEAPWNPVNTTCSWFVLLHAHIL